MTITKNVEYQKLVLVDRIDLSRNIGFVKAFLELLYGCYTSIGGDPLSGDLLYMIDDARDYLEKSLTALNEKEEVKA